MNQQGLHIKDKKEPIRLDQITKDQNLPTDQVTNLQGQHINQEQITEEQEVISVGQEEILQVQEVILV